MRIEFLPGGNLALEHACKVVDGDARVGVGIVDDDGQTVVGNGHCPGQVLTVDQVLALFRGEVAGGEGEPCLQLHQLLHGILLVDIERGDGVEGLCGEIVQLLVEDRIEAFVGSKETGCLLVGFLLFRIRLAPTCVEQA